MVEIADRYQLDIEIGGRVSFARQLSNSLHRHNFYEFCYCLEGHGDYLHNATRRQLRQGDVFVSEPNVRHEISSYGHQNLEIFFLRVAVQELAIDAATVGATSVNNFLAAHSILVHEQFRLQPFVPLLESGSGQSHKLTSAFALEMMDALADSTVSAGPVQPASEFEEMFRFIDSNLHRKIEERELADLLGVSDRTLRRRFRSATGTTIRAEINHRRMRSAAHQLLTGFSVQEVTTRLGIADAAQFHRSFLRTFGVTPKKFQLSYLPGHLQISTRP